MFCNSVRKQLAAMMSVMNGADLIVFTGGIGEHDAGVRTMICHGLSWLGIVFDAERNKNAIGSISGDASLVRILVLPSREDEQIARHSWARSSGTSD